MARTPSEKQMLNKGAWTAMEDKILTDYIKTYGQGRWSNISKNSGLKRCGKSCRLRWLNYLRPGIKRGNISEDEEELIIRLHKLLGNRWSLIAGRLPGRTDNEIKNYWNTIIGKKIVNQPSISPSPATTPEPEDLKIYQNATHPYPSVFAPVPEMTPADEPFSPDEKNIVTNFPELEGLMMDLDVDNDFMSDILNEYELSQLVTTYHHEALLDRQCDLKFIL